MPLDEVAEVGVGSRHPAGSAQVRYPLSTAVYACRPDGSIALLKRNEGSSFAGHWFLPGGIVDGCERPEHAAARELQEESGLCPTDGLVLIGSYPVEMYGETYLQMTYACHVGDQAMVTSDEHDEGRWIDPGVFRAGLQEQLREIERDVGDSKFGILLQNISDDLDRYMKVLRLPTADTLDRGGSYASSAGAVSD